MLVQVNIGLNNNSHTYDMLCEFFALNTQYRLIAYDYRILSYKGNSEPTFVALLETKFTRNSKVLLTFENLCSLFTQECIAIVTDRMEALAFNHSCNKAFKFDSELFSYITVKGIN